MRNSFLPIDNIWLNYIVIEEWCCICVWWLIVQGDLGWVGKHTTETTTGSWFLTFNFKIFIFIHNSIIFFTAIFLTTFHWKFFWKSVVAADSKYLRIVTIIQKETGFFKEEKTKKNMKLTTHLSACWSLKVASIIKTHHPGVSCSKIVDLEIGVTALQWFTSSSPSQTSIKLNLLGCILFYTLYLCSDKLFP